MWLLDADAICNECIEGFLLATCEGCVIKDHKLNKSVDAVTVVRCKDCLFRHPPREFGDLHCGILGVPMKEDDFCSYGERKGGEADE